MWYRTSFTLLLFYIAVNFDFHRFRFRMLIGSVSGVLLCCFIRHIGDAYINFTVNVRYVFADFQAFITAKRIGKTAQIVFAVLKGKFRLCLSDKSAALSRHFDADYALKQLRQIRLCCDRSAAVKADCLFSSAVKGIADVSSGGLQTG